MKISNGTKKIIIFSLVSIFLLSFAFIPLLSSAQAGLVPCGTESYPKGHAKEFQIINPCDFNHIFDLINKVVNFLLVAIALPLAAIMFAYAGFLFMFSGMQPEARSKAKRIFGKVALGFILAVAAWVIVHTVLSIVGYDGAWIGL